MNFYMRYNDNSSDQFLSITPMSNVETRLGFTKTVKETDSMLCTKFRFRRKFVPQKESLIISNLIRFSQVKVEWCCTITKMIYRNKTR